MGGARWGWGRWGELDWGGVFVLWAGGLGGYRTLRGREGNDVVVLPCVVFFTGVALECYLSVSVNTPL